MRTQTVYMANAWFNDEQERQRKLGMEAMKNNASIDYENSFRPMEHQYKGWTINDHPDLLRNAEWQRATFDSDVRAIDAADIVIAIYDPKKENSDPGVVWELGYAFAKGKPVFIVLPDNNTIPLNLMPALSANNILFMKDLADFDFNNKSVAPYEGPVY